MVDFLSKEKQMLADVTDIICNEIKKYKKESFADGKDGPRIMVDKEIAAVERCVKVLLLINGAPQDNLDDLSDEDLAALVEAQMRDRDDKEMKAIASLLKPK